MNIGDLCEIRCVSWDANVGHFVASISVKYPVLFKHHTSIKEFIAHEVDASVANPWGSVSFTKESAVIEYILRRNIDPVTYECTLFNKELDIWL